MNGGLPVAVVDQVPTDPRTIIENYEYFIYFLNRNRTKPTDI